MDFLHSQELLSGLKSHKCYRETPVVQFYVEPLRSDPKR